ncbi:extracellular solute-binding protein [Candidatus Curtissbacteria bacterium]|nr:extracellular solute-binding protein [Candidatus Curtissbacteria bacterium]
MPGSAITRYVSYIRKLFLVSGTLLLATALSACSILPSNKNQQITLKYWGIWESSITMNQVIADYKKIKPNVDIVYEKRAPEQYRESLQSQIQGGKGPDVFLFHNTWTAMLKNELAPAPPSIVSDKNLSQDYYPTIFFDMRNSSKNVIGLPTGVDGLALYWNEDIFRSAGIPAPPTTWQELSKIAAQLTVKDSAGNIKTGGIALGTASNVDHFSDILGLMLFQNGGDPKNPTDKASADALEYYANFAKGPNKVWDETLPASTVAFTGGNLAMYLAPSWRAIEIKNANPLLNFKVAPAPQLEGGQVNWATYWASGVSAKSQNSKEAWEFVKYLNEEQTLIKLYNEAAKSPGRFFGEPYPRKAMGDKLAADPVIGAYISEAPTMRSFPMASRTFDNGINDQIIKAYEDAVNSVAGGTPATSALQTAANVIKGVIAKYSGAPAQ